LSIYGCHNKPRPVAGAAILVQDGYVSGMFEYESGNTDRIDRMVTTSYVMSTPCQYTKQHASDPECSGCAHRDEVAA